MNIFEYFRPEDYEREPERRVVQRITIDVVQTLYEDGYQSFGPSFTVKVDDAVADGLCFDECLGLVASLIVPHRDPPYLRTPEQQAAWDAKYHPRPLEPWRKQLPAPGRSVARRCHTNIDDVLSPPSWSDQMKVIKRDIDDIHKRHPPKPTAGAIIPSREKTGSGPAGCIPPDKIPHQSWCRCNRCQREEREGKKGKKR